MILITNLKNLWTGYKKQTCYEFKENQFFGFTNRYIDFDDIVIKVKETSLKRVTHLKFLGVTIDEKMDWNIHVNNVCNRLSKGVGILFKLQSLPQNILKMLYNTLILPHLNYCMLIWANSSNLNMDRIFKLQKKAIRIISHSNYIAHTMPIFSCLKILTMFDMYLLQSAIFMYLCSKKMLPTSLLQHFCFNDSFHSYQTRNAMNYHIPKARTSVFQKSIFFNGPKIWNDLPEMIKNSPSLNLFKRRYKQYLLATYSQP